MPYKHKAERNRNQRKLMRGYRAAQVEYVGALERQIIQQAADIALLRAMLGRQEYTGYSWEREQRQDAEILTLKKANVQLQVDMVRLEMLMDTVMREEPYDRSP